MDRFHLEVKKDTTALKRLFGEGNSEFKPVKNTFRLTGKQLNSLRMWAMDLKMGRSEILRRIIEHYI